MSRKLYENVLIVYDKRLADKPFSVLNKFLGIDIRKKEYFNLMLVKKSHYAKMFKANSVPETDYIFQQNEAESDTTFTNFKSLCDLLLTVFPHKKYYKIFEYNGEINTKKFFEWEKVDDEWSLDYDKIREDSKITSALSIKKFAERAMELLKEAEYKYAEIATIAAYQQGLLDGSIIP